MIQRLSLPVGVSLILIACVLQQCDLVSVVYSHILKPTLLNYGFLQRHVLDAWILTSITTCTLGSITMFRVFNRFKFFTVIAVIFSCCLGIALVIFVMHEWISKSYNALLILRFFYVFFSPAMITIPMMFCFKITPPTYHRLLSVFSGLTLPLTAFQAHWINQNFYSTKISPWYGIFIVNMVVGFICLIIARFAYSSLDEPKIAHENLEKPFDLAYVGLFIVGAVYIAGAFYPTYITNTYLSDILIMRLPYHISSSCFHWMATTIFLFPAAYFAKKIGLVSGLYVAIGSLVVNVSIILLMPDMNIMLYIIFQLIFVFAFALLLVYLYFLMYKFAKKTSSIYTPIIWCTLGHSVTRLALLWLNKYNALINLPVLHTLIFAGMIYLLILVVEKHKDLDKEWCAN